MLRRLIAPVALVLALSACAPAPAPTGAGAPSSPAPSATPAPAPTPDYDVPVVQSTLPPVRAAVPPVRVQIGAAGIDIDVIPVGVEAGGFMELPENPAIAGWYRFGSDPWSPDGNTVISAHIDAPEYPIGPFAELRGLVPGSEVTVLGQDGAAAVYDVASVTYYPKQDLPTDEIFARMGTRSLVLITCGGAFDSSTGRYADNVVVVAAPRT